MSTRTRRWIRKVWPELPVKPPPGEGLPERRRVQYVTRDELQSRDRRLMIAIAFLAVVCSAAAWLGYQAGQDSSARDRQGERTTASRLAREDALTRFRTCVSGAELRIVVAGGLDGLRRGAIPGLQDGEPIPKEARAFFANTQFEIDSLLQTAAAGADAKADKDVAPSGPAGEVTTDVEQRVRSLAMQRCERADPGEQAKAAG